MLSTTTRPLLAALLLLGIPVAAFLAGRPEPLPPADFRFVLPKENATFDPAAATSVADQWLILALFEGLTRLDPVSLAAVPAAAEYVRVSDDGLVYTFELRRDGRWSDGAAVSAGDFLHAWRRLLDPTTGSPNAFLLWPVAGAEEFAAGGSGRDLGLSAPDPWTFVVRLRAPCPYFLALAAHFAAVPVRQDVMARHGDGWTDPEHLVSNGPYQLVFRRVRDRVRLRVNEAHREAAVLQLRVIDALVIESAATALNLYLTGAVDWVNGIPSAAVPWLRGRDDLHLGRALAANFLRCNVTVPPLGDVRVRRAIDRALDRDALCRYVLRRGDHPARSLVPPALPGYVPAAAPAEDAAAARGLLAAAGFPGGQGFPELELLHAADETSRALAEAIADRLLRVLGIRVRPAPQEFKVYLDSQKTLRYQLCIANWYGDYPDPTTFLDLFRAGSSGNRTGWRDARYEALLDDAADCRDVAARMDRLREAEHLLLAEGPIVPLSHRGQPNLVAPHVTGFAGNLLDLHPLDRLGLRSGR